MFLIITIVSLTAVCVWSSPVHSHQPNHATSSQSFYRHDVPLAYNFSSIHIYTTPNPEQLHSKAKNQLPPINYYQPEIDPLQYKKIQYAPVRIKSEERQSGHYTKVFIPSGINVAPQHEHATEESIRKDHLEPRKLESISIDNKNQKHKFIPGHNVEVLQPIRSPAHDTIFKTFPGSYENSNSNKINIGNEHNLMYRQPAAEPVTSSVSTQTPMNTIAITASERPYIAHTPIRHYDAYPNIYTNIKAALNEKPQEQSQPQHAKVHRLHLNVARVYNIAQIPKKAPENVNPFMSNLNIAPSHTQAVIIPNPKQFDVPSQQKTFLFPVPNDNRLNNDQILSLHNLY